MSTLKQQYPLITGEHHPILRAVSSPVETYTKEIKQFARHLLTLMHVYHGVGLAAPQVGYNIRIIATSQWKTDKHGHAKGRYINEMIMINPIILERSEQCSIDTEGCLSLPGLQGKVSRSQSIIVQYQDLNGQTQSLSLSGLNARIIQHEIDHLDGILYIDKLVGPLQSSKSTNTSYS